MCLKRLVLHTVISICLLLFGGILTHSQRTAAPNRNFTELQRAVERGTLGDERRVSDYAITNPNDPKALELLARLRFKQGRISESQALYRRILKLDPNSVAAKIMSSRISLVSGQRSEAVDLLSSINDSSVLQPELKYELAAVLMLAGEIERSLSLAETLPPNIKNSIALPLLGSLYFRSGHIDQLVMLIPAMKRAAMLNAPLAIACSEILRDASRLSEAIAVITSVRNYQNDVGALIFLARLEVIQRDFVQARQNVNRATILKPGTADVLSAQAFLESVAGNLDEAFKLISRARDLATNSSTVLYDLAIISIRNNKPAEALNAAKALVAIDPTKPEFRYVYGAALLQSGDLDTAQTVLEAYVKDMPSDSRGCLALGMTYVGRRDRIAKAREQLAHCFAIDPSNTEARYQLALTYRSQGENKPAISLLEEVVRVRPDDALALRDLGTLYFETGDAVRSRPMLENAAKINPNDADTHFQLARLYSQIGEAELAKKEQEIFRKLRGPWGKTSQ